MDAGFPAAEASHSCSELMLRLVLEKARLA